MKKALCVMALLLFVSMVAEPVSATIYRYYGVINFLNNSEAQGHLFSKSPSYGTGPDDFGRGEFGYFAGQFDYRYLIDSGDDFAKYSIGRENADADLDGVIDIMEVSVIGFGDSYSSAIDAYEAQLRRMRYPGDPGNIDERYIVSAPGNGEVIIKDNTVESVPVRLDLFQMNASGQCPSIVCSFVNDIKFSVSLIDYSDDGAVPDALTLVNGDINAPLVLEAFDVKRLIVQYRDFNGFSVVAHGELTGIRPVPEPSSLALLCFGLVGLGLKTLAHKQNKRFSLG